MVMMRFVLCVLLLCVFLCYGGCVAANIDPEDRVDVVTHDDEEASEAGNQKEDPWEEEEKREEASFVFVKPDNVLDARKVMLDALQRALDNATDAAKQCREAKEFSADADNSASEVERLFELVGYKEERAGQLLRLVRDAKAEADAALDECVLAENRAADADVEVVSAAWNVLNHSRVRTPAGGDTRESLKSAQEHAALAAKHAARAGRYAVRAKAAAEKARVAAERGGEAKATASEIAKTAQLLSQKLLDEKQGEWDKLRAEIESEKMVAKSEAAKMAAMSEAATRRAVNAEATAKILQQQIANAKLYNKDNKGVVEPPIDNAHNAGVPRDGVGCSVCGHAMLMLFLPTLVFAAVQ